MAQLLSVTRLASSKYLLSFQPKESLPVTKTTIIAICDESGSMCGEPFASCLSSLEKLLMIQNPLCVVFFDDKFRILTLNSSEDVKSIKQRSGGTSFCQAIEGLKQAISDISGFIDVIMFTDGQSDSTPTSSDKLNDRCRFHVIGLGNFSDTSALLSIRRLGYEPGNFGFASSPSDLMQKIEEAANFAGSVVKTVYRGQNLFLRLDGSISTLIVDSLKTQEEISLPVQESSIDDELEVFGKSLQNLAENPNSGNLRVFRETFNELVIEKSKKTLTKPQYQKILKFAETLNDISYILHQSKGSNLSNVQLAKINECAQKAVTRRFTKLADKRAETGEQRIQQQDEKLIQLKEYMQNADLSSQPTEYICAYTTMSVAETLREGDCMCIGVRGGGKDVVIANPYLFSVEEVTPTFLSFTGFTESAYFTLRMDPTFIRKFTQSKLADELATGMAHEKITGVIPLYLNEEHWKIASLIMDRATATLICKDPTLGTFQHRIAAVFLALQWCLKKHTKLYDTLSHELQLTLKALFRQRPDQFVTPQQFLNDVKLRLPMTMPELRKKGPEMWKALEIAFLSEDLQFALFEEHYRRNVDDLPKIPLINFGDYNPFLIPKEENEKLFFLDLTIEPVLPTGFSFEKLEYLQDVTVNDENRWKCLSIIFQLQRKKSVSTTEWPDVRQEFQFNSSQAYIKQLYVEEIKIRRQNIVSEWSKSQHYRCLMKRKEYIFSRTDDELTQEDFDDMVYMGKGEIQTVLLDWVRTPKQLRFAVNMRRLDRDKTGIQLRPIQVSNKMMRKIYLKHSSWITKTLLRELWPHKADHIGRLEDVNP